MFPTPDSADVREGDVLADRVDALAAWLQELDVRLRTAEVATGDEKTAKELRKAIQALAKHDPKLEDRVKDSVDVVNDRLAMLAETVATTSAALAAKDGEIVGLRRALEAGQARIDELATDLRSAPSPVGLDDLRKEIAALSARPRGTTSQHDVDGKIQAVGQRLDMLHETVATTAAGLASRDGELALLRRQVEEDVHRLADAVAELRIAKDPVHVAELRLTVKELTAQATALEQRSGQALGQVTANLQEVSARLDSLSVAVERERSTSAEELSQALAASAEEREAGLAVLRSSLEQETGRLDSQVTRIEQALTEASSQLGRLEGLAERDAVEALEGRVQGFGEGLDALSGRLSTLSRALEESGQGADERAGALSQALAELSQSVEQEKAGFARALSELRSELHSLAEAGPGEELEARLHDLSAQVQGIGQRLRELDALGSGARDEAAGMRAELQQGLGEVGDRLQAVERERAASSEEREALAAGSRLLEERVQGVSESLDALSARLASLSRTVEETGQGYEAREQELGALRTEFDEETGRLDSHVARIEQVVAELTSKLSIVETSFGPDPAIVTRLEVLAQAVEAQAAVVASANDGVESGGQEIADLRAKAAESEQRLESVAAGLRGAMDALAVQLDGLAERVERSGEGRQDEDTRLDGLDARIVEAGARVDALAAELRQAVGAMSGQAGVAEASERHDLLERRLDSLAADLEARSASKETDLMLGKILLRVDDLARRLDEVEQTGGTTTTPDLGELEARMEQAETAARENRESVLVQLERLASRVEYRLDRLESEQPAPAGAPVPEDEGSGARVVPLRGNEA